MASVVPLEESFRVVGGDKEPGEKLVGKVYSSIREFAMDCVRENIDMIEQVDQMNRLKLIKKLQNPNLGRMQRMEIYTKGVFEEVMGGLGKAFCYTIPINCYLFSSFVLKKQYVFRD